jgi:chromosomal replication initiation ATPase DnaA
MVSKDLFLARKMYKEFVKRCTEENDIYDTEFLNECTEYRSEKSILIRNYSIDDIILYVSEKAGVKITGIGSKHCHKTTEMRAICAFLFRCFCNKKCKDICSILGNITQSRVSKLCSMGLCLINKNDKYKGMIEEFLERYKAA